MGVLAMSAGHPPVDGLGGVRRRARSRNLDNAVGPVCETISRRYPVVVSVVTLSQVRPRDVARDRVEPTEQVDGGVKLLHVPVANDHDPIAIRNRFQTVRNRQNGLGS